MNATLETILNRRSVRVYSDEQIKQQDLDLILKAGSYAPSGCNMQPWHFSVIQNKDLINKINEESKKELLNQDNERFLQMAKNENYNIFYNAPTVIVVSGEKTSPSALIDCSAAAQNMILAAQTLNIGTCWIGLCVFLFRNKVEESIKMLGLPEGYEPYFAITFGYKKYSDPKPAPRRENVISYIK